jgi:hypothetical protein
MSVGNKRVALGLLAGRFALVWKGQTFVSWDDLRDKLDAATGSELDCQPLDILTDMTASRLGLIFQEERQ